MTKNLSIWTVAALAIAAFSGCNSTSGTDLASAVAAEPTNQDAVAKSSPKPGDQSVATPAGSCVSGDSEQQCVGLRVVSYKNSSGTPVVSQEQAAAMVNRVNDLWRHCKVAFQIDEFVAVDPTEHGLQYGSGSQNETSEIRDAFNDNRTFLVAITGPWADNYLAWTAMPGSAPYGVVIRGDYGTDAITVAHELGHYSGLDHVDSSDNLLYPYLNNSTTVLTQEQCNQARETNLSEWAPMLRT